MRWLLIGLAAMLFVGLAFTSCQTVYDDGLWALSVTINSTAERPIKGVSAHAFLNVEEAQKQLANLPPLFATRADNSIYAAVQEPKADEPLKVNVPTSKTTRWMIPRFNQYRGLLVVVEYEDGKLEGRAVEIPDLRRTRQVTVEVP